MQQNQQVDAASSIMYASSKILFLTVFICSVASQAPSTLRLSIVLFRHGDRTAFVEGGFDSDPNKVYWLQHGSGQLVKSGMTRARELGQFLKNRYAGFLSSHYNRTEMYMRSTDMDRTLMSAQCVLAGLYPAEGEDQWGDPPSAWQPIPVHTRPTESDYLLLSTHNCEKYTSLLKETLKSTEAQEFYDKYSELADVFRNNTGENKTNIWGYGSIFDNLVCAKSIGLAVPTWATTELFSTMLNEVYPTGLLLNQKTEEMKRLHSGSIVGEITTYFRLKHQGLLDQNWKLFLYSAHDTNVAGLLISMGVFNHVAVPYSAAILIELHQKTAQNDSMFVQISYRNDSGQVPHVLTIPGCQEECPLETFLNLTENLAVVSHNLECLVHIPYVMDTTGVVVFMSVGGVIVFLVLVIGFVNCCKYRCRRRRVRVRRYKKVTRDEELPMMNSQAGSDNEEL